MARPNKQLQGIIETIKNMNCEELCEEHGEKLHLFCEDDDQLICLCCERKPQHKGHVTVLAEDVYQDYKEKLLKAVTKLRDDKLQCNDLQLLLRNQKTEWQEKVEFQRQKIHSEFEALQTFLEKEQKHYLKRLEREEERTLKQLQEDEDTVQKQSQDLRNQIMELESKCQDTVRNLMEHVKLTLSRCSEVNLKLPEVTIFLDLHTVCNVSDLYFDVRDMLKRYQVRVTLDPDTAHNDLLLSEDGRKVTGGCPQKKLCSSSRFTFYHAVLGRECFSSGRHYFEVYVEEDSSFCALGVCLASVKRGISVRIKPEIGFWAIGQKKGEGIEALTWRGSPATQESLSLVGVFVDYEAGLVSFYNVKTGSHIFTFPKATFSGPLLPYFLVFPSSSLIMYSPDMPGNKQSPLHE